jgi:hypothetical protein
MNLKGKKLLAYETGGSILEFELKVDLFFLHPRGSGGNLP